MMGSAVISSSTRKPYGDRVRTGRLMVGDGACSVLNEVFVVAAEVEVAEPLML